MVEALDAALAAVRALQEDGPPWRSSGLQVAMSSWTLWAMR